MLTPIMVPLDGSLFSEQALPVAYELASQMGCPVHVVKVHTPVRHTSISEYGLFAIPELDKETRDAEEQYLGRCSEAVLWRTGHEGSVSLLDGPIADQLEQYAKAHNTGLIVMTTHGRGGLSRAWLGSVADELVRSTNIPVLLLRPSKGESVCDGARVALNHIVVPLDGSALSEAIIPATTKLAGLTDARLTLLQVVPAGRPLPIADIPVPDDLTVAPQKRERSLAYLNSIASELRSTGFDVQTAVMRQANVAAGILEFAITAGADLIAMSTHGRSGVKRMAIGSVADKVLRGTEIPLLLLRPSILTST